MVPALCPRHTLRQLRGMKLASPTVLLITLLVPPLNAEILHLTNGRQIQVERYWEEGKQIYYERNGSIFGFPSSLLERVDRGAARPATKKTSEAAEEAEPRFRNEPHAKAVEQARASAEKGDLEKASHYYRQALHTAPESVVTRVELGELYLERGNLSAAQIQLELAKRSAPEDPTIRELLGDTYYRRGRTALAIRQWQKTLELAPGAGILDKLKQALRENERDIDFDELRCPHFLIRYDGAINKSLGQEVAMALESEYEELTQELHFTPQSPVKLTLYTNREFSEVTHAPSWVSALNDGEIMIPVEGLNQLTPQVRQLLRHELTHTFINARTGNNCPTWFHEGYAQLRANQVPDGMYEALKEAKGAGGLLPLWSLEGPLLSYSTEQARLAYYQSLAATQYLVKRKGKNSLIRIMDLLARRYTMNEALNKVIGLDYQELQTAWETDLGR